MLFSARIAVLLGLGMVTAACSPARMGFNRMAAALTETAAAYSRDDDPEFVRTGAPATLKMVEMMLDTQPSHPGLLMTACSGFAQYAYAFLHLDSEVAAVTDARAAHEARERAARMYTRARGYCLRALRIGNKPLGNALERAPAAALPLLETAAKPDVAALFWTGATWAGELALAENQLERLAELALVRALLTRALELDEAWGDGTIHEAMIAIEGLPRLLGGSPARARQHFERATALSQGESATAYVTFAASVAVPARNRTEFENLLKQALGVDLSRRPTLRVANLVAQKRARFLLSTADRLFN